MRPRGHKGTRALGRKGRGHRVFHWTPALYCPGEPEDRKHTEGRGWSEAGGGGLCGTRVLPLEPRVSRSRVQSSGVGGVVFAPYTPCNRLSGVVL